MASAASQPPLTVAQVLASLERTAPEFAGLVKVAVDAEDLG